jgi:AIPR protein
MSNASAIDARKELIQSMDTLARRAGISRDKALTAWYAGIVLGIDEDDAIEAASIDGPEDAGCDFIYVDEEAETLYVLQGYVSDRVEKTAGMKKWNALTATVARIQDPSSFKQSGRSDIAELLEELEGTELTHVLGLVTLAARSDQIDKAVQNAQKTKAYGATKSFFYEHQETLYDKYLVAKTSERTVPADTLTFAHSVASLRGGFGEAIVGTVPASELVRLHDRHGNRLFEGNVRLFIGQRKGGINEKIVETATARPGEFWALNNGITIVAETFQQLSGNKYELKHFSIVNGCQTTVSLCKAVANEPNAGNAQVMVRVVGAKKALVTDIVRFNNTQNPVKLSAVRLLDPIQEALRLRFQTIDYSYAPKQEGARAAKTSNRIELERIAQYLAATKEETVLEAVSKKIELFDRSYKNIFPRSLKAEEVFLVWQLALAVDEERIEMLDKMDTTDVDSVMKAILGIHGTPWGIFVAYTVISKVGVDFTKLSLKQLVTPDFNNAIKKYAKKSMELYADIAVGVLGDADESTQPRNQIRTKQFLDKLKRMLSVRSTKLSTWKLPKLNSVGVSSK